MPKSEKRTLKINLPGNSGSVSGILNLPDKAKSLLVLAHGAGADMNHSFMEKLSGYLADEGIGSLRYNFPFTEKKGRRPDSSSVLTETVRAAVKTGLESAGDIPVFAGGKSMGGRMTSMAASLKPLEGIKGIIFFGFPLHAPGKPPSTERAEHLFKVNVPMLFLQGTRDKLADLFLLKPVISKLSGNAVLHIIEGADHSFHMLKSSGRNDDEVLKEMVKETAEFQLKIKNYKLEKPNSA